jgi:hypothetical protein
MGWFVDLSDPSSITWIEDSVGFTCGRFCWSQYVIGLVDGLGVGTAAGVMALDWLYVVLDWLPL